MTGLGHLPMPSEAASTCDMSYLDNGRACAWNTFLCEDFVQSQTVPDALQTCFYGSQQSPINLDVNEARIEPDPGQLTFNGYEAQLGQSPAIRLRNFALQIDFEETSTTTTTTMTTTTTTTTTFETSPFFNGIIGQEPTRRDVQLPNITGGVLGAKT